MKKRHIQTFGAVLLATVLFASCRPEIPMVSLGIDDTYAVPRMKALVLHPQFPGTRYVWTALGGGGGDSVVSEERDLVFCSAETGVFRYRLQIEDPTNPYTHEVLITVWEEEVAYSPYITRVYEYCPAPGQFVNLLPEYEAGDTYAVMLKKAEESIGGTNDVMISLGAFGGYITFGFDHSVMNVPGQYDFKIYGNAFYATEGAAQGSSEPGIVMVSFDRNQNGLPDDAWFELAGSEYHKPETQHHYRIAYERPDADHSATPHPTVPDITDTSYIRFTDSEGKTGYVTRNAFHRQNYYPQWIQDPVLHFEGTRLADNFVDESGNGSNYVLRAYDWGYVDNHPNEVADKSSFNIEWAVDGNGNPVHLPCIDFVRVYTGVNQSCGWLGETSTELSKAEDLHIEKH